MKRLAPEVFFHLQNSTFKSNSEDPQAKEFYSSQAKEAMNNMNLMICCSSMCRQSICTMSNGTVVNDKSEWINQDNPCEQFVCTHGMISTQVSLCRPLSCEKEHHVTKAGECCPVCGQGWADFCETDDDDDCDIACQFGFVRNEKRGCDECKCAKQNPKSSSTSTTTTESPSIIDDATTESVKHNFYFYPDQNIFFFIAFALSVTIVACIVGLGLFFHRKVYKRVPIMSTA
jgi:hypothetical protein